MMRRYGLIGKELGHSWSQQYFEKKFADEGMQDCCYELYASGESVSSAAELAAWLHDLVEREHLLGFNVTIPFKQWILPCLDAMSPVAKEIGAVNCVQVIRKEDGTFTLTGHNTDAPAFESTLLPLLQPWHKQALVLGTGGAAHAVAYALRRLGIEVVLVSRNPEEARQRRQEEKAEEKVEEKAGNFPRGGCDDELQVVSYQQAVELSRDIFLVVNATPKGMSPHISETPWSDVHNLSFRHLCYDLIYNPVETRFLLESELAGAVVKNGEEMLHRQAELSWEVWQKI